MSKEELKTPFDFLKQGFFLGVWFLALVHIMAEGKHSDWSWWTYVFTIGSFIAFPISAWRSFKLAAKATLES